MSAARARIVVTGMGLRTAIASSVPEFERALRVGRTAVRWTEAGGLVAAMALLPGGAADGFFDQLSEPFVEARTIARRVLRAAPLASNIGCAVALEAILAAGLAAAPDWRESAILVAGNNIHQRYMEEHAERFRERPAYLNPRYAVSFFDTHVMASLSEIAGLAGPGFTVGGSMASGNAALYQAWHLLQSGAVPACICVGALADYGSLELRALSNLGALATGASATAPGPYPPFDRRHSGFAYGQGSACVVLETEDHARGRGAEPLAELAGVGFLLDGHAASDPSPAGEASAMRRALALAGASPADVDYVNAHGTGTPAGDDAECEAIENVFAGLPGPRVNSTKTLTGHTLYAAGIVELVATVLQMNGGFLHPMPHLDEPISSSLRLAGAAAEPHSIRLALSNSFSIGGINTCAAIRRISGGTA
jgi:malonyl-ACP decarboxylase